MSYEVESPANGLTLMYLKPVSERSNRSRSRIASVVLTLARRLD